MCQDIKAWSCHVPAKGLGGCWGLYECIDHSDVFLHAHMTSQPSAELYLLVVTNKINNFLLHFQEYHPVPVKKKKKNNTQGTVASTSNSHFRSKTQYANICKAIFQVWPAMLIKNEICFALAHLKKIPLGSAASFLTRQQTETFLAFNTVRGLPATWGCISVLHRTLPWLLQPALVFSHHFCWNMTFPASLGSLVKRDAVHINVQHSVGHTSFCRQWTLSEKTVQADLVKSTVEINATNRDSQQTLLLFLLQIFCIPTESSQVFLFPPSSAKNFQAQPHVYNFCKLDRIHHSLTLLNFLILYSYNCSRTSSSTSWVTNLLACLGPTEGREIVLGQCLLVAEWWVCAHSQLGCMKLITNYSWLHAAWSIEKVTQPVTYHYFWIFYYMASI